MIAGLLVAGAPARRAAREARRPAATPVTWLGLALVLAGQLLRAPSAAGAAGLAAAAAGLALAAASTRRAPGGV